MNSVKRYRVFGRVQGVGFRYFVSRRVAEFGGNGWVRNMTDGTVEALISASDEVHSELRRQFEQGPRFARVESVSVVDETDGDVKAGFEILRDGS